VRAAADGTPTKVVTSARWIPGKDETGRLYVSAAYAVHPNIMLGIDYRPLVDQVGGFATWRLMSETRKRPGLIVATSNDDFNIDGAEINSQSASAVLSKGLPTWQGITVGPYAGGAYIFETDEPIFVGGASFRRDRASIIYQWSGTNHHLTASYDASDQLSVSFIHWGLKYPGMGMRFRF